MPSQSTYEEVALYTQDDEMALSCGTESIQKYGSMEGIYRGYYTVARTISHE